MRLLAKFSLLILLLQLSTLIAGKQQFAYLGDFKLENGQVIKECKIGYRTFGKLNAKRDNVVLFPSWFGGASEHLGKLIGPQGVIDSSAFYIIAVDALGNGISSSPSNSRLQPGEKFPTFSIADMVNSQYLLLTRHLQINHLYAIIGGSMGGMQTFEWMVRYPDFMEKAIPYVGTPQLSSYDYLFWQQLLNILTIGWRYGVPADTIRGQLSSLTTLNIRTPGWVVENWTMPQVKAQFKKFYEGEPQIFTNQNFAAQTRAMLLHDVSKAYGGSLQKAARRVKASALIIVVQTDHMVNPIKAIQFVDLIHAQKVVLNDSCGHLGIGCNLKKVAQIIKKFLENQHE